MQVKMGLNLTEKLNAVKVKWVFLVFFLQLEMLAKNRMRFKYVAH